jgi:hypothetical protein
MDSAVHQVASASVAALFSIGMFLAAHLFTEYRSSRMPAITIIQPSVAAVGRAADSGSFAANWGNRAF